jgi:hypothetical protein
MTLCLILMFSFASVPGTRMRVFQLPWPKMNEAKLAAHTRQSADTFLDLLKHRNHARIVTLEPGDVGVDFETKNSFAIETSIDVGEIHEAADKQDCTHGQHKGDRDLSDDEDFTDWASGGAA